MSWETLGPVLAASSVAAAGWGLLAFALARAVHRTNAIDTMWSLGFALVAVVAFASSAGSGDPARRGVLLGCTLLWALRLAWFVGRRSAGRGDDPRYVAMLERLGGNTTARAIAYVFVPQTVLLYVVSLTLQVGMVESGPFGVLGVLGCAVWLLGLVFEAVGDHQMNRFRADPRNRGTIIDRGLWRWTRHPNYFGDAAVWAGLYLIAAQRWPGALTILSPAIMIYLLAFGSGARLLERTMGQRPGYDEYARRTSGFVPVPPWVRRSGAR